MLMNIIAFTGLFLLSFFSLGHTQDRRIPNLKLAKLDGTTASSKEFLNDSGLTVISFFALWCKPCIQELDNISEKYESWQKESGVKVVCVSIDDSRNASKLPSFVNGRDWPFEFFKDTNSEFKRALNVVNIPHVLVASTDGNIIWQHTSYVPGDEDSLYTFIQTETRKIKDVKQNN